MFAALVILTSLTLIGTQKVFEAIHFTLSLVAECGFKQIVHFPALNNNTLDLVATNRPSLI